LAKSTIKTFRCKDDGKLILDTTVDVSNKQVQEMAEKIKELEPARTSFESTKYESEKEKKTATHAHHGRHQGPRLLP
jgi:hypothetical protein